MNPPKQSVTIPRMPDFDEATLAQIPIVVLDTETTGLESGLGHRVTELGAVRYENWKPIAQINQLIQPQRHVEEKASEISGITDQDLVGQPLFADVADDLIDLLDGALVVAHNAEFDAKFIGLELWLAHRHNDDRPNQPILPNPWLCTLRLARAYFHFGSNKLANVAMKLGAPVGRSHRALNDVQTTAEVIRRMSQQLNERFPLVGDLLHAQGGGIYTQTPPSFDLLPPINMAFAQGIDLRIQYLGPVGESERRITVRYPTTRHGKTYIIAFCHLRQQQRAFRLDRIFSAELIE